MERPTLETKAVKEGCGKNKMSEYEKVLIKTIDKAEFIIRRLIDVDKNNLPDYLRVKYHKEAMDFIDSLKLIKREEK